MVALNEQLAFPAPLAGNYLSTNLPNAAGYPVGTQAQTFDKGAMYSNGVTWQTTPIIFESTATPITQVINQPSTGFRFAPQAVINRENDRTFIGGATVNDGQFPPVSLDWLSAYQDSVGYTNATLHGELAVLTNPTIAEGVGITTGASTIAFTNASGTALAIEAYALHNNTSFAAGAWAYYGEAHKRVNSGVVYGAEFDIHTGFPGTVSTPYNQGDTIGIQLADGAGIGGASFTGSVAGTTLTVANSPFPLTPQISFNIGIGNNVFGVGIPPGTTIIGLGTGTGGLGTYTLSANLGTITAEYMTASQDFQSAVGMQVWNNIVPWNKGIVFGQYSVIGCDGVNGTGIAMSLAKGHIIEWRNSAANITGEIFSNVVTASNATRAIFTDSGFQIGMQSGGALAFFPPVTAAANWLVFSGAVTGASPTILANGGDTNVNLKLGAQGTGVVNTIAPLSVTNGFLRSIRTIAAATDSVLGTDSNMIFNFSGTVTETLPVPSAVNTGRELTLRTVTANAVNSASSNVIPLVGGAAAASILAAAAGKWAKLVCDGTNWQIMASN
jgi:hypothetical protein